MNISKKNQKYNKMNRNIPSKYLLISAIFLFSLLGNIQSVEAQFLKRLKKRAEEAAKETIAQKVENKSAEKTGNAMDSILNADKKIKRKKKRKGKKGKSKTNEGEESTHGNIRSAKDFVPGNKVIFSDQFLNDAIGDFPVTWNTNSSGEVITFEGEDTRWLQLSNDGQFTPDGITDIPENATFEFDLYVPENYSFYSSGLWVNFVEVKDRRKDFTNWQIFRFGSNGVRLWLHPADADKSKGKTGIYTYVNKSKIIDNKKQTDEFTTNKNLVHISVWRQKTRIRVYIDDKKVWDLPRAFDNANYNSVVFNVGGGKDDAYIYVANLRLAVAGEDTRHALLETGKFETNEILFDVNKSSIKASSFSILDEIGQVLQENSELKINIIGHTDGDGKASTNQRLSEDRARSVKEYFIDHFSIAGNRLQTEGKGASEPVDDNTTAEGKANNRRVEFVRLE